MYSRLFAERVGNDEPVAVALDQVVARVTSGEVIVLRRCLQELGYLETFQLVIQNAITDFAGAERSEAIMDRGVEWLHLFVTIKELTEITKRLQNDLSTISMTMVKRVARELLQLRGDVYAEEARNIRIFVPHDYWMKGRDEYLEFERERN